MATDCTFCCFSHATPAWICTVVVAKARIPRSPSGCDGPQTYISRLPTSIPATFGWIAGNWPLRSCLGEELFGFFIRSLGRTTLPAWQIRILIWRRAVTGLTSVRFARRSQAQAGAHGTNAGRTITALWFLFQRTRKCLPGLTLVRSAFLRGG